MFDKKKNDSGFVLDDGIEDSTKIGLRTMLKEHIEKFKGIKRLNTLELLKSKLWNREGDTHFRILDMAIVNNKIVKFYVMKDYTRIIDEEMPMKGGWAKLFGVQNAIDYEKIPIKVITVKAEYVMHITHKGGLIDYKITARHYHQNPKYQGTEYGREFDMLAMETKKREHEVTQRENAIKLLHTATNEAGQVNDLKDSYIDRRIERKMKQEAKISEFQQRPMQPQQPKQEEGKP